MFSRAFAADPFVQLLYPDGATRHSNFVSTVKLMLRYGLARGEVQAVSSNLEGTAVWFPPAHVEPSVWDQLRFGFFMLPFRVGMRSFRTILAYSDHTAKMRRRHLRAPYWYLQMLAVDPAFHGRGHAVFLLRSMLDRLDRERTTCCLDTENEVNVSIYEHFGFRLLEKSNIPGCDCPCWLMAREPA